MQQPDTRYATRPDGVNIAYQVWGSGSVDPLYAPGFISHLDLLWADPGYVRFFGRRRSPESDANRADASAGQRSDARARGARFPDVVRAATRATRGLMRVRPASRSD